MHHHASVTMTFRHAHTALQALGKAEVYAVSVVGPEAGNDP